MTVQSSRHSAGNDPATAAITAVLFGLAMWGSPRPAGGPARHCRPPRHSLPRAVQNNVSSVTTSAPRPPRSSC